MNDQNLSTESKPIYQSLEGLASTLSRLNEITSVLRMAGNRLCNDEEPKELDDSPRAPEPSSFTDKLKMVSNGYAVIVSELDTLVNKFDRLV